MFYDDIYGEEEDDDVFDPLYGEYNSDYDVDDIVKYYINAPKESIKDAMKQFKKAGMEDVFNALKALYKTK